VTRPVLQLDLCPRHHHRSWGLAVQLHLQGRTVSCTYQTLAALVLDLDSSVLNVVAGTTDNFSTPID
jgi:hypothetical protein